MELYFVNVRRWSKNTKYIICECVCVRARVWKNDVTDIGKTQNSMNGASLFRRSISK